MSNTLIEILPPKTVENVQTTQYNSTSVKTVITKCTARNYSGSAATLAINIVDPSGTASSSNLVVLKTIQPGETYMFPEVVGQVLTVGAFISTLAGTASAIMLRISGYQVT